MFSVVKQKTIYLQNDHFSEGGECTQPTALRLNHPLCIKEFSPSQWLGLPASVPSVPERFKPESVHHLTETHIHTSIQEHTATNTQHMDSRQQVLQITSGTEALVFSGSQSDSPSNGPFHIPPAPASLISSNSTHLSRVETLCSYSALHKLGRHRGAEANSQCGDSWFGSPGQLWVLCVEFACSPRGSLAFLQVLRPSLHAVRHSASAVKKRDRLLIFSQIKTTFVICIFKMSVRNNF